MSIGAGGFDSRGPQTLGGKGPQVHRGVQRFAGGAEFHRHVHRARRKSIFRQQRRLQAGLRPDSLPPRVISCKARRPTAWTWSAMPISTGSIRQKRPPIAAVMDQIRILSGQIAALQKAPLVEPFAGPTLLTGRAAAVFFHEVLGHRLEGFRQKDVSEGQTFTSKDRASDSSRFHYRSRRSHHKRY